jgi:hypothetical protein
LPLASKRGTGSNFIVYSIRNWGWQWKELRINYIAWVG